MRTIVRFFVGLLFSLGALQAYGITLSPNSNGGSGNIPGTYPTVDFYTNDGDWAPTLTLPETASQKATITIHSNAQWDSNIVLTNTDLPLHSYVMRTGDVLRFSYNGNPGRWISNLNDAEYTPIRTGATIPNNTNRLARYIFADGSWTSTVTLPAVAEPGAIMIVQSFATSGASIAPTNVLHAGTMNIAANEKYAFSFHPVLKKWYILEAPTTAVGLQQLDGGNMRSVTRPRTELMLLGNATPALTIKLPPSAGDRDRVRVASASTTVYTISNSAIDYAGTLKIGKDDVYEFMWLAEKSRWTMMSSPSRSYAVDTLANGQVPSTSVPTTWVKSYDGSWHSTVTLPAAAKPGDRVLVESAATWSFNVVPGGSANFSSQPVTTGDTIAFLVNPAGLWTVETRTITMLNLYGDKVATAYGTQAARARQIESFRLTNEALENSRTNFRLKMVGLTQVPEQGATMIESGWHLHDDPVVLNERKRVNANAVFYEGATPDGCTVAYISSLAPDMFSIGSTACGTTSMRHGFGHNMGLADGGETNGSAVYGTGYNLLGTIMASNAIPYYSTPLIYDPKLGIAMGIPGVFDSVRAMNERSELVSTYH